jgi:formylglycine-generating enzyme required for sulfatase activity/tRNA A-37 threonylcarbamoyl transferase component Bud32
MTIVGVDDLIQRLRQRRLLEPEQLDDVTRTLSARPAEPRALAGQLIQRGWLTPYQINQLFLGRDRDLVLGPYVLLERLGEGGMGKVFKARHAKLGRIVALKVIRKDCLGTPRSIRRFHREIQAVARLSHPNIVHALDADQDGETHFLVMEYVEGIDLARLVRQCGPLPVPLACECIRQAALGLQHIHEHGLVHRDLKPHNLLLCGPASAERQPSEVLVKLLDLGLARLNQTEQHDGVSSGLTRQGFVVGTTDYVAPEQAMNSSDADIRADLYSLGCTFYHLLTGRVPFPGGEPLAKLVRHQSEKAEPIERLRPDVPPGVAALIRRLMAKRREKRFQTPAELALALAKSPHCGSSTVEIHSDDHRLSGPSRSLRRWAGVLAGVCVVIGVSLAVVLRGGPSGSESPPAAISSSPARDPQSADTQTNSLGMKLVRIPAGDFLMGSPTTELHRAANEGPPRRVTIPQPFYLGAHLVTVGEFRAFILATGYQTDAEKGGGALHPGSNDRFDPRCTWRSPGWEQTDRHPVACLSWPDAAAFCDWLSEKEGRMYRLPTEAEWEYANRAGSTTAYSFGDAPTRLGDYAWFADNSSGRAHPVGRRKPNAWGLYDMHGQLFQWCADWYDPHYFGHRPGAEKNEPPPGGTRVQRGGSWRSEASECRAARRIWDAPANRRNDRGGFRVLLETASTEHSN